MNIYLTPLNPSPSYPRFDGPRDVRTNQPRELVLCKRGMNDLKEMIRGQDGLELIVTRIEDSKELTANETLELAAFLERECELKPGLRGYWGWRVKFLRESGGMEVL